MRAGEDQRKFDQAAEKMIELGNQLLEDDYESDSWEVAFGLLAGAVHFWLYAQQPCSDLQCEACSEIDIAKKRLERLTEEIRQFAEDRDYFHGPHDVAGNA